MLNESTVTVAHEEAEVVSRASEDTVVCMMMWLNEMLTKLKEN